MSELAPGEQPHGAAPDAVVLWLAVWLAASAALAWQLATAWPYEGHWSQLLMLFTLSGAAFRALEWLYRQRSSGTHLTGRKRFGVRVLAIVVAVLAGGATWQALAQLSMRRFERTMAPLVAQMHAHASSPCPAPGKYDAALGALARSEVVRLAGLPGRLAWGPRRFVFWIRGGSMDIDGSTIWYDSVTRRWSKFHNDNRRAHDEFDSLLGPLVECPRTTG